MPSQTGQTELKFPVIVGFQIKEQIGGGGFSTVYRAANPKLDMVAACKVVPLSPETTKHERKELNKEIQTPWVPGVYMLLEISAGGDLFDKIAPDVGIDEEMAHLYFNQLAAGIIRDLLLDVTGRIKMSDFGLCSVFRYKNQTRNLTEQCGSLPHVAPGLVYAPAQAYQAEPVDIWGMGVILFIILCGNSPEYARFLSGRILYEDPWNRIPQDAMSLLLGLLTVDVQERMNIFDILQHLWTQRSNKLTDHSGIELAEHLTRALRVNGDMELAEPNLTAMSSNEGGTEEILFSQHAASQFTQSLQLFSQSQNGTRYCPHLTPDLMDRLLLLNGFGVEYQPRQHDNDPEGRVIKIGGYDKRKEHFTGYVEVENFSWAGGECKGSFCVMRRDKGSPISWRQLWKALIKSPEIEPHVLRRRSG
ncbi:hypothetical protein M422DRAFT_31609 [Sphaerobolus stellatus SS14]|uniref:non-specific serine/threonine protein kinase n=1 Tax=Sphaerobolus stellatus (strain SS14) TaxID=990650 RepID=A0A0C9VU87_SPHS4|nr:hypothetical protein M422DRAFT_31609 [Sphaerobolus stellatus SS14]